MPRCRRRHFTITAAALSTVSATRIRQIVPLATRASTNLAHQTYHCLPSPRAAGAADDAYHSPLHHCCHTQKTTDRPPRTAALSVDAYPGDSIAVSSITRIVCI